jgi:hypothetical protein
MAWTPITSVDQLVDCFENSRFDYKTTYDLTNKATRYEIAKDVAAFANAYGGTIVVGVFESGGKVVRIDGVADVPKLMAEMATALKKCSSPVPVTPEEHAIVVSPQDAARLLRKSGAPAPVSEVTIVTLNVRPDTRGPIGVHVFDGVNASLADVYRFPVRIDDQTRFLNPTELPMWMNSHERRVAIQLREVFSGDPVDVIVHHLIGVMVNHPHDQPMKLSGVDEARGVLEFTGKTGAAVHVPFLFVPAVWRDPHDSVWRVAVRGTVFPNMPSTGRYSTFVPSLVGGS